MNNINVSGGRAKRKTLGLVSVAISLSCASLVGCGDAEHSAAANIASSSSPEGEDNSSAISLDTSGPAVGKMELFGAMMGTSVFIVNDGQGNHFGFECEGENAEPYVSVQLSGKEPPPNSDVHFDIDGVRRVLPTDGVGSFSNDNKISTDETRSLWSNVRGAKAITVRYSNGVTKKFGLANSASLMGKKVCTEAHGAITSGEAASGAEHENDENARWDVKLVGRLSKPQNDAFIGDGANQCTIYDTDRRIIAVTRYEAEGQEEAADTLMVYDGRELAMHSDGALNPSGTFSADDLEGFKVTVKTGGMRATSNSGDVVRGSGTLSGEFGNIPITMSCLVL